MRITSAGNVGIGTTGPDAKLTFQALGGGTGELIESWKNIGGDTRFTFLYDTQNIRYSIGGRSSNPFFTIVETSGNVGIGTVAPNAPLQIAGDIANTAVLIDNNAWYSGLNNAGSTIRLIGIGSASNDVYLGAIDDAGGKVIIREDGTDKVTISGGNVGIGTTAPNVKLDILSGTANAVGDTLTSQTLTVTGPNIAMGGAGINTGILNIATNDALGINIGGSLSFSGRYAGTSQAGWAVIKGAKENATAGEYGSYLAFGTRANGGIITEKMRITSSSNVGIGTAAPASLLDVTGGLTTVGGVFTIGTNEPSVVASDVLGKINFYAPLEADGTDAIAIGASIAAVSEGTFNTTTNTTKLSFMTAASEIATEHMALSSAGVLTVTHLASGSLTSASGVITSSSDERLKDITGPLAYGLAEVMQLRPIRYHWNERSGIPTGPEYGGFGAAQVEQWIPLAVSYGDDGMRSLSDRPILGALVNAVQEQQGMIDELKLMLNGFGLLDSTSTSDMAFSSGGGLMQAIKNALQSLGMALQNGVAMLKEVVVDKFTAKRADIEQIQNKQIQTEQINARQICVSGNDGESVCLTKDQLKDLIKKAGSSVTINQIFQLPSEISDSTTTAAVLD